MKPTPEQTKKFDEENELDIDTWEKVDIGKNTKHVSELARRQNKGTE